MIKIPLIYILDEKLEKICNLNPCYENSSYCYRLQIQKHKQKLTGLP